MSLGARYLFLALLSVNAHAKTFQNSYVSFEVPDDWSCLQEGVAWTCTPVNPTASKEAVIVLAAKVAGPEDTLNNFQLFLKQPKKIITKVGTPMPSAVMYAQQRMLGGHNWVQAQHLSSEILEYYTLYLATVKDQLAILVSFSAEQNRFQVYNPIFDKAVKTLKIVANQKLLFPKNQQSNSSDVIGIQVPPNSMPGEDLMPPPELKKNSSKLILILIVLIAVGAAAYIFSTRRKKISHRKSSKPRAK